MATDTGPLHDSPLAKALTAIRDTRKVIVTWTETLVWTLVDKKTGALLPLGTQTLRALEVWREAGEPEITEYDGTIEGLAAHWREARWWGGKGGCWWVRLTEATAPGHYSVDVQSGVERAARPDEWLLAATALQAAHALAAEWRAEREQKKAATAEPGDRQEGSDDQG